MSQALSANKCLLLGWALVLVIYFSASFLSKVGKIFVVAVVEKNNAIKNKNIFLVASNLWSNFFILNVPSLCNCL